MAPTAKLASAMVVLAFCSFLSVLVALHLKSKLLFLIGITGCVGGVLIGIISIFITIGIYLKSPPK